jgi:hypothetical protein
MPTTLTSDGRPGRCDVGDLAADVGRRGLAFPPLEQTPQETQPVVIVTTNDIPGFRITEVHGDAFGLTVRAGTTSATSARHSRRSSAGRSSGTRSC